MHYSLLALFAFGGTPADCPCTGAPVCDCGPACKCPAAARLLVGQTAEPCRLEVCCPAGAVLTFDGARSAQAGTRRSFLAPRAGTYLVRCRHAGLCLTKRVTVGPSFPARVRFDFPRPVTYFAPPPMMGFGGGGCRS